MGAELAFSPEKLVAGVMIAEEIVPETVWTRLEREFGPIDYIGHPYPFSFTAYYEPEMGPHITKYIISFRDPIPPQTLAAVKHRTNEIENEFAVDGGRRVNLDPGIMDLNRFILATTKNRGHRIPLADAIYGELTLIYIRGRFEPLPWTYADYKTDAVRADLEAVRKIIKSH